MKYYQFVVIAGGLTVSSLAFAASTCQEKQQEIELQIEYAQKYDNPHRVAGLRSALAEIKANCTADRLQARQQHKIAEKQRKVAERAAELQEAEQRGDMKKIMKQTRKLHEAREELDAAKRGEE